MLLNRLVNVESLSVLLDVVVGPGSNRSIDWETVPVLITGILRTWDVTLVRLVDEIGKEEAKFALVVDEDLAKGDS